VLLGGVKQDRPHLLDVDVIVDVVDYAGRWQSSPTLASQSQ
jgi:hypothetical protein